VCGTTFDHRCFFTKRRDEEEQTMKARFAMLAAAAAIMSIATFSTPAQAQYYHYQNYGRTMTRCDSDGDRCATFRCDWDGDDCTRISGWYRPNYDRRYSYGYGRYGYRDYNRNYDQQYYRRRDNDDDDYSRCDADGDDCR
jgi:hypothetical protein